MDTYYEKELGKDLFRKFVSFRALIIPDILPSVKRSTNMLEAASSDDQDRREINIDPGYVSLEKVVLSSCKNFSHRLYLSNGVYGEVTLIYAKKRGFVPLKWTYPDYAGKGIRLIMEEIRRRYKVQLKKLT